MTPGSFGPIAFEVSGVRARTFSELGESAKGRWATHNIVNSNPISEFLGPDLDELTLKLLFSKMLGLEPQDEYEKFRKLVRKGEHFPLFLNGQPVSQNEYFCAEISGEATVFGPEKGNTLWMEVEAVFKEYN